MLVSGRCRIVCSRPVKKCVLRTSIPSSLGICLIVMINAEAEDETDQNRRREEPCDAPKTTEAAQHGNESGQQRERGG